MLTSALRQKLVLASLLCESPGPRSSSARRYECDDLDLDPRPSPGRPRKRPGKIVAANEMRFGTYRTHASSVLSQINAARGHGYNLREVGLVPETKSISSRIKTPTASRPQPSLCRRCDCASAHASAQEIVGILLLAARSIEQEIHRTGR